MRKIISITIALAMSISLFSQEEWTVLNSGINEHLYDIFFTNESNGWACGLQGDGKIIHTTDGGVTWVLQHSQASTLFNSIYFVDNQNGWCVARDQDFNGLVLHTVDGGENWESQSLPSSSPVYGVFFTDPENGWATGGYSHPYPNVYTTAVIFSTNNGGQTWELQYEQDYAPIQTEIFFINENKGFSIGDGSIRSTSDGGNSWSNSYSSQPYSFSDITFIDENRGWAVGLYNGLPHAPAVVRTMDGGNTWTAETLSSFGEEKLNGVCFQDELNGWAVGGELYNNAYPVIIRTTDGGESWTSENPNTNQVLNGVWYANNNVWAVGRGGVIINKSLSAITSIENENPEIVFGIYPNPAVSVLNVDLPENQSGIQSWKIYNSSGMVVLQSSTDSPKIRNIDVTGLSPDIYIFRLEANNTLVSKRFVVVK